MEVEGKKMGGGGKILGMRLQWEGHVDRETILYGYASTCTNNCRVCSNPMSSLDKCHFPKSRNLCNIQSDYM